MPVIHGKATSVLVDQYNLSIYFNSADYTTTMETAETTTFGASAKTFLPGLLAASVSLSGFFDTGTGGGDEILRAALSTSTPDVLSIAPQGITTIGNRATLGMIHQTSYQVSAPVGDVVAASAEMEATNGLWGGVVLADLAARTTSSNTSSVDNAASSANGGVANVHLTGVTALTSLVVKIQHSTDNSSWSDLITFATLSAVGAENKTVTGTVNRYTRVLWTLTGTSVTFAVTFARK